MHFFPPNCIILQVRVSDYGTKFIVCPSHKYTQRYTPQFITINKRFSISHSYQSQVILIIHQTWFEDRDSHHYSDRVMVFCEYPNMETWETMAMLILPCMQTMVV